MAPKHAEQVLKQRMAAGRPLVTGAISLCALLACVVVGLAVGESTRRSAPAGVASALGVGLLAGLLAATVTRATAGGPLRSRRELLSRGAVAIAVGAVVGEFAALVVFAGSVDRRLDEQAARRAEAAPAVAAASADLNRARGARSAVDDAVAQARKHRDEALVVARCEYHPSPACPQTRITGVPGAGPETRTADEELADAQRELDSAVAARDHRAPTLDAQIADAEMALGQARRQSVADRDAGLGARWVALQELTVTSPAALLLRVFTAAFCMLLYLLPLLLRLWRRETTQDRRAAAEVERERAEVQADTAIAVKRAEVRAAAEALWADHQLTTARLAVEAQAEIDRAHHRRRVAEALKHEAQQVLPPAQPVQAVEPARFADVDVYLPIAAEAEAASRAVLLPAAAAAPETDNLPTPVDPVREAQAAVPETGTGPVIPNVTKAAARWIRPLVPTFVARAIDTTTQPLRAARQVFEEVEEITFSLRRTRKVTVDSEETLRPSRPRETAAGGHRNRGEGSSFIAPADAGHAPSRPIGPAVHGPTPHTVAGAEPKLAVEERDRPDALEAAEGPRQLPPGR